MKLVLDTNILGKVCHPKAAANRAIAEWLQGCLSDPTYQVLLPEIADYEMRRILIWRGTYKGVPEAKKSLERLDQFKQVLEFLPLDSDVMLLAAEFWARARATGLSVDPEAALGADLILAAQVYLSGAQVVTENRRHLERFVSVFPLNLYIH